MGPRLLYGLAPELSFDAEEGRIKRIVVFIRRQIRFGAFPSSWQKQRSHVSQRC